MGISCSPVVVSSFTNFTSVNSALMSGEIAERLVS
jgi:hypothetical protein